LRLHTKKLDYNEVELASQFKHSSYTHDKISQVMNLEDYSHIEAVDRMQQYIHSHLHEPITLSQLSQEAL